MQITTIYNFGDIILVPFPFTNQSSHKKRPAVVISSMNYQQSKADLIVMAVTSQIQPVLSLGEFQVQDWQAAGLLKPSLIKPVITTVEKRLIIKKLGQLQSTDLQQLRQKIEQVLG